MDKILQAIHDELVLSYTQAGRVVPTTVAIVAAALMDALRFSDAEEVHESFKRARMMADVPKVSAIDTVVARIDSRNCFKVPIPLPIFILLGVCSFMFINEKYILIVCKDIRNERKNQIYLDFFRMLKTLTLCAVYFGARPSMQAA